MWIISHLIVLFNNENSLSGFGHDDCSGEAANATSNDNGIEI